MNSFEQEINAADAFRHAAGAFARAVLTVTPQGVFAVSVDDMHIGHALRMTGQYNVEELNQLGTLCGPLTKFLTVGANIGALCIPLAKRCQSMVAIEAHPETFELLQLNAALNNVPNCRVIHKAASNKVEQIEFVAGRTNPGGSKRMPVIPMAGYFYENPQVIKVEAAPLDEVLPGESFDIIMMDIEGSEYFALQGMQRILAAAQLLIVEFLPHHLHNVAGISVETFLEPISPHFSSLVIARKKLVVGRDEFLSVLSAMFNANEEDTGLQFFKQPPENIKFA